MQIESRHRSLWQTASEWLSTLTPEQIDRILNIDPDNLFMGVWWHPELECGCIVGHVTRSEPRVVETEEDLLQRDAGLALYDLAIQYGKAVVLEACVEALEEEREPVPA